MTILIFSLYLKKAVDNKSGGVVMDKSVSQISREDIESIEINALYKNRKDIVKARIPVLRENSTGSLVLVPLDKLEVLLGDKNKDSANFKCYIRKGWQKEIEAVNKPEVRPKLAKDDGSEHLNEIKRRTEKIKSMPKEERIEVLAERKNNMARIEKEGLNEVNASAVMEASTEANMVSKVSMFEAMAKLKAKEISEEEAKQGNREIAEQTNEIVNSIISIIGKNSDTKKMFSKFDTFSEGSTVAHSNRVFVSFITFIAFYNNFLNKGGVTTIRANFQNTYLPFYRKLLPNRVLDTLEETFEKGLGRLNEKQLLEFSTGALIHDLGKIEDIAYYESDSGRDIERIKQHVFQGYYLILKTSEYPPEIAAIAGYHHEYYGHPSGYGLYRSFLEMEKKAGMGYNPKFVVSYDFLSVERFNSVSYFPSKVLEIIDVYDALTDPSRKYRQGKVFSNDEALEIMLKGFIIKDLKIDPILFDIFVDYLSAESEESYSAFKVMRA